MSARTGLKICLLISILSLSLRWVKSEKAGPLVDLNIMALFPMTGSWAGGESYWPAVQMGLEHVNNREDILPGYRINMISRDTGCNPGFGVHVMYEMFYEPPPKLVLFGAGCSKVSQPTAESSHFWNITQMSYASVSPPLSDKSRYPRFFRVSTSDLMMNPARMALMKHFGWERVSMISESLEIYTSVAEDSQRLCTENNITVVTAEIFRKDTTIQMASLKKHDARIIFAGCYEDVGVNLFCQAYKQGMYGPHIVWILPAWWNNYWWLRDDDLLREAGCTVEQMTLLSEGTFYTGSVYLNPEQQVTEFGITSNEYWAMYKERVNNEKRFAEHMSPQGFDGVMAVALALNHTLTELRESGSGKRLEDYTYDDIELSDMIKRSFWKVRFQGVKGPIYFNEFGDHPGMITIERIQNGERITVGIYKPLEDRIDWEEGALVWPGGSPPADSTTVIYVPVMVTPLVYGVMCVVAAAGILLAIICLIFNYVYRNKRLIKMSSPFINNIILVGCIVVYGTVFVRELTTDNTLVMCEIRKFSMLIGFSTVFGALFAKTWRVHVIFTNKLKKMVMKDRKLVLIVSVIVGFDIALFIGFTIFDPVRLERMDTAEEYIDNGNTRLQYQVYLCGSEYAIYFDAVVYATKGILLIFGTFLAWETRKVTIPALNDSQLIGISIYNVVVLSTMGVILAYVLIAQVELQFVLTSSLLILGTTMTQAIIFIPKIMKVKEMSSNVDESDDTKSSFATGNVSVRGDSERQPSTITSTLHDAGDELLQAELDKAKTEIERLKKQLKEKEAELESIKKQKY